MKRYLITAVLLCASPALAQSVPIESDARLSNDIPRGVIAPAVALIEAHGWHCDSVSALTPFIMSRGFTIICNHWNYKYNIEDKGGNWEVSLD